MDKNRAYEIFGLHKNATKDELARRYDVLQRKIRSSPEKRDSAEARDLEEAYKILAGITWRDPVAEKRLREREANPGFIAKLLKIDQNKLDNIVHYYKVPVLAILVVTGLIVWFVISTVFRPADDFRMTIAGDIYVESLELLEEEIQVVLPGVLHPLIQNIYYGESTDNQMQAAVLQKLMVEIGYGENDILIVDRIIFDQYSVQGAFIPLDDRLEEFRTTENEQEKQRISLLPDVVGENDDGKPHVYGINVTNSLFLKETQVLGKEMIAVFGLRSEFPDRATALMMELQKVD